MSAKTFFHLTDITPTVGILKRSVFFKKLFEWPLGPITKSESGWTQWKTAKLRAILIAIIDMLEERNHSLLNKNPIWISSRALNTWTLPYLYCSIPDLVLVWHSRPIPRWPHMDHQLPPVEQNLSLLESFHGGNYFNADLPRIKDEGSRSSLKSRYGYNKRVNAKVKSIWIVW